jgi:antitoxin component YwqK of YwqJK toxin-antitoxin module
MKRVPLFLFSCALFTSCQNNDSVDQIVSQTFVHKYGFETSEKEWEAREKDGQVVSMLKNGVKVCNSFENGVLHGPTTYTFPHSSVIEKSLVYDQGSLLKEQLNDPSGMPIKEEVYEFDNRIIITLWDGKGVPLSIEEYDDEVLMEAKYYTPEHELEASVVSGFGERIKRDRTGLLISRDQIENGLMTCRTTFHPNGGIHTVSHYENYKLHGSQKKYTASGRPLMELNWNQGVLDGAKIVYRNGSKIAEIPYHLGQKHGTEFHYDDLGNLTAEIEWRNDKKHGATKLYTEETSDTEWFFNGQSVNAEKFKILDSREKIISEFRENEVR